MSILDVNVADGQPVEPVEPGEYKLECISVEIRDQKPEKGSGKFIMGTFEVVAGPKGGKDEYFNAGLITQVLMIPDPSQDRRMQNNRKNAIKEFLTAFELPLQGADLSQAVGHQAFGILRKTTDERFGPRNEISRWTGPAGLI